MDYMTPIFASLLTGKLQGTLARKLKSNAFFFASREQYTKQTVRCFPACGLKQNTCKWCIQLVLIRRNFNLWSSCVFYKKIPRLSQLNSELDPKRKILKKFNNTTVAPRYNEDPVITSNIYKPGRITVKYVCGNKLRYNEPRYNETPTITNWFWRSQRAIYPAITYSLSCRSQSVKTTWWYKWLISQTWLLLVKIGKLWPSTLYFSYM